MRATGEKASWWKTLKTSQIFKPTLQGARTCESVQQSLSLLKVRGRQDAHRQPVTMSQCNMLQKCFHCTHMGPIGDR
jgi:hypothetical protein